MSYSAVVTGAGRGVGRAVALELARRGASSITLLSRSVESLEETAAKVRALGAAALSLVCDVASEADVERASVESLRAHGAPGVLVNNAGIVRRDRLVHETAPSEWDEVIGVNLRGPFLVTRAFLPAMLEAKRGRIVQVGSISSTLGCPGNASYAASKWGLIGFTKSLAEELRGTGLVAAAVLPGSVDTEMLRGSGFEPRMSAEDVARLIAYAALDAPPAITGSAIEMFG